MFGPQKDKEDSSKNRKMQLGTTYNISVEKRMENTSVNV
jgi:hypothetical protein